MRTAGPYSALYEVQLHRRSSVERSNSNGFADVSKHVTVLEPVVFGRWHRYIEIELHLYGYRIPFVSVLSPGEFILKKNRVRSRRCKCETKYLRLLYFDLMSEVALSDFDPNYPNDPCRLAFIVGS